jgi:hypothetical protein
MIIILMVMFPVSIIFHIIKYLVSECLNPMLKRSAYEDQPQNYLPPNFS